jgi:glycosyltransferase involved in cell wall biosynthesis
VPKLSVTVITRNEQAHIASALESVSWADEVVVVDCGSVDETTAIAEGRGARVLAHDWTGYGAQKNNAADAARNDWVFVVDADERVTPELAAEIRALMAGEPTASAYRIPRVAHHLGRWIRGTDWYPDYQMRLYNRRAARWDNLRVHESLHVDGPIGRLRGELLHYPYRDIADHGRTIDRYTRLAAEQMVEDGRRAHLFDLTIHPFLAFLRNYLLLRGFAYGKAGLVISIMNAYYVFMKYAKLWELQQKAPAAPDPPVHRPGA